MVLLLVVVAVAVATGASAAVVVVVVVLVLGLLDLVNALGRQSGISNVKAFQQQAKLFSKSMLLPCA